MKKNFFVVLILIISCKNNEVNTINSDISINSDTIAIFFPDIIESNKDIKGEVFYNFDEYNRIKNNIGTGDISRYIHLYTLVDTFAVDDPNYFTNVKKDTFLTQNINKINFKIRVNKKGKYFINTLIKDIIIFDTLKSSQNIPAKISEIVFSKEIIVH